MKSTTTIALLLFVFSMQAQPQRPCASPESSQFDFWVGDWYLTWGDTLKGRNIITKELGDCVIHENFSDSLNQFFGQSFSVYNPNKKKWEQTWVDNAGSYLDFEGEYRDGKMILSRDFIAKSGGKVMQRMVFYNIETNSFDWSWESSTDEGKNWKQNWLIHYVRKN